MIVIHYKYWRQCDKTWQHRTKSFKFVRDAFGFCLSCKKRPNTYIESWLVMTQMIMSGYGNISAYLK